MNFIKSLLSPRSRSIQQKQVSILLSNTGVEGSGVLKQTSIGSLVQTISNSATPDRFMKALLGKIEQIQRSDQLVKLLNMIHGAVCLMEYRGQVLDGLQHLSLATEQRGRQWEKDGWFKLFYRSYVSYLAKLPSVSEVYIRARQNKQAADIGVSKTLLVDLFRIVNQVGLLLDALVPTFNTIGRYYKSSMALYRPMYRLLRQQFTMLYLYMRSIVQYLFARYETMDLRELQVFIETIPELQIMTDKLEEFLMCKYFQGNKLEKQLYFKADQTYKIIYFLQSKIKDNQ